MVMRSIAALALLLGSPLAFADAAIPIANPAGFDRHFAIAPDSPSSGSPTAELTIVEFADFQCPYSARVADTLKELQKYYGRELRLVYRNYPLPFHRNARPAAVAAMAAHAQGKFLAMHDLLFRNFQHLDPADLERYAVAAGLDLHRFHAALAENGIAERRVAADLDETKLRDITGTPTFFINGHLFVGARPIDDFKKVLDDELARADAELARGTPRERLYDVLAAAAAAEKKP